jgi:hypothetical protein
MTPPSQAAAGPRWIRRTGWTMTGLMVAFLLFDNLAKIALERHVIAATAALGYPPDVIRPLGIICLI